MAERIEMNGSVVAAWGKFIAGAGISGTIAFYLVYVGANEIPRQAAAIEGVKQATEINRDLLREHKDDTQEILRLMRWVCAGVQKNDADRRQCFEK